MSRNEVSLENPGAISASGTTLHTDLAALLTQLQTMADSKTYTSIVNAIAALQGTGTDTLTTLITALCGVGDKGLDDLATLLGTIDADTSGLFATIGADNTAAPATALQSLIALAISAPMTEATAGRAVSLVTNLFHELIVAGYQPSSGSIANSVQNWPGKTPRVTTAIDQLLDDDPTSYTSEAIYIGDARDVSILLKSDVTAVGNSPQVTYTVELSPDNSEFKAVSFVTDAGFDTPEASVVHASDDEEWIFLLPGQAGVWLRVVATGADTDADDTVACDAWVVVRPAA